VRIAWEQLAAPWLARRHRLAVWHALAFVPPVLGGAPAVVTVYDLGFLRHPGLFPPARRRYLRWGTRLAARRARRIVTLSEDVRRQLVDVLGVPPERVRVVPGGVDARVFAPGSGGPPAPPVPRPFVLHVGTLEARKNLARLVRAFARARAAARLPHHLVLAGPPGRTPDPALPRAVEETGLASCVHRLGYVEADALPALYRAAALFVYPSLYEGFGLPPLEAMASGVPVVASGAGALRELVGEAGLCVDPLDEAGLAEAIALLLTDPARREAARVAGMARARAFTWARTAEATAAVYREVLAKA
jgi:glycosyltransferase involved in cell wall biosynthesis